MPQEISVSYLAIKNKVYKLIDATVSGEKSEADVQDSVRRWWSLIHPADRPVAKKYLLTVLGRSMLALEAIGETSSNGCESASRVSPTGPIELTQRIVKEDRVSSAV